MCSMQMEYELITYKFTCCIYLTTSGTGLIEGVNSNHIMM